MQHKFWRYEKFGKQLGKLDAAKNTQMPLFSKGRVAAWRLL